MWAEIDSALHASANRYDSLEPGSLYSPVAYMIRLGGKRVRPMLTCLGAVISGSDFKVALQSAIGIEVFHNFTLVHDDIMDAAPLRRNQPTVHTKWNINTAILAGDVMFAEATLLIQHSTGKEALQTFLKAATEVCEGQQWDMEFETIHAISIEQYLRMIELKTAVLLAASLKIGALVGNGSSYLANELYAIGILAGISFQLHDDWLDAFGDPGKTGKQPGGDILAHKKTWLMISLFQRCNETDREAIEQAFQSKNLESKVSSILELYRKYGLEEGLMKLVDEKRMEAFNRLDALEAPAKGKALLKLFLEQLAGRQH
jgi:geranylgeranyl diphosphate synthase type II